MKVKLDDYEVRMLINGLFQQRLDYDGDTNAAIDTLLLRLVDISDAMKPNHRKRIHFEPKEAQLIRHCFIEW